MTRFILLLILMTTQVFAQTECYLKNEFEDGTYGFFLQEHTITVMKPFRKFLDIERVGSKLISNEEVVGQLKLSSLEGVLTIGDESSSFECTVWHTGGRG